MKEPRLEPDSPAHGVISYDARIAADTDVSASSYASTVSSVPVESLEVHTEAPKAQVSAPMTDSRFKAPFSRQKAAVVSAIITVLVVLLTGGSLVVLNREAKQPDSASRLNLSSQDIQLKNQSGATTPAELQGVGNAVLINGDLITRGQLKVTSGAYLTLLRPANLTSNRNLTLPDASGVLCVDSNNCGYATSAQLQQLQAQLGQIVLPDVPPATTVNGLVGAVSIQGASNQISVTTANGVIALATPQDLAPISSPTFANMLLNGNFSVSGTVTLPLNCSGMLNGGALTTNASGQVICSGDDASGGGGASVTTPGGTAGNLALFTAADTIADSIISQALGAITIGGDTAVSGALSANSLTLATALSVANGGTGATTFTTNGVLLGNGTGAVTSTTAPSAGQVLLGNTSNVPQFTTISGDVVITGAGVTAIQADSVALSVDTTGNYVANLGALTGLTTSGNTGEGSTPTLSVVYGSSANTAVQGNVSITVNAGSNLTGGGSITLGSGGTVTLGVQNNPTFSGNVTVQGGVVTMGTTSVAGLAVLHDGNGQTGTLTTTDLASNKTYTFPDATGVVCLNTGNCVGGTGGAPNGATYLTIGNDGTLNNERAITAGTNIGFTDGGANGNFTISTVNNPSFSTSVTTPLLQSSGALSITPGGALTVGATGQTALLQGSTTTITSNGAGNDIVLSSADQIRLSGFNCTTFANGGALTTDASGNLVCADDDGGAGGAITGTGTANRIALFTGAQTMADSWLLQNGSTLELDNTRNLSLLGGNFSVTGTGTFSGLLSANGNFTVESGDTFTMNGDAFTDLTGTGLVISSGSLQTTLGTSVDLASEITGTLGVANGGTGVNGSTATNGQLLIGNGTGYTLATLTPGAGISITNGAGSITVASSFGASVDLGVETTGNYQAGTTAGNGIAVSGTPSGGWSPTVALGALTANWDQTGAFDIVLNNANSELRVLESAGGTFFGTIDVGDLTADHTYTFPDASGTICLSTGNCAGAGGGITGSGTADTIAKFTGAGTIGDSSISDDGSVVTVNGTANLVIQGGTATFGTTTQAGTLTISDGSSNTVSIVASAFAGNQTYTLPDVGGAATFCMSTGNCVGGAGGGAPNAAAYLVASLDGTLTNERALAAGNNISLTDGGAGSNMTVATVQNPTFTTSVTTPLLQSSGALTLVSAAGEVIAVDAGTTIELQDSTNVTGNLDVSIALNVGTADAFQVNSSGAIAAATGITSSGTVTFSALNCTTFTNGGKVTTNVSGQLVCSNDNGAAAGTITGTGTNGTLPIFTATNVIADSIVTQSGTTVNIAGDLTLSTALAVDQGGTGATSFTTNGVLYGNNTSALQVTAAGTSGQVLVANVSGVPTFVSFSGDVAVSDAGATTIQANSVALGTDTTGNYVSGLTAGNGVSITGTAGEGWSPSVAVVYGSSANTAVQGDTTLTCASGTGNLSGGGDTITLGTGGTCSAIDTVANPTFTTSVTTPLLQSTGALAITPGGALTVGATGQTATLQGSTTTITSNGVGNDIVLTSADAIRLTGFNCTTFANGGVLTTDAFGNITCADDNGVAASTITGSGTNGTLAVFTGANTIADSIITQSGTTISIAGALTVQTGDALTVNGDAFTDLTGTGLVISSGSLQTTLGTSVDLTSEVTGTLGVSNGGTGAATFTVNGVIYGNGTGALQATAAGTGGQVLIANASGVPTFMTLTGDLTVSNTGVTAIQADSVALGTDTTGNYVASLGSLTGLTTSGNTGEGSTPTLSVTYGSTANTAVQGDTTLICPSGTGNLSGGGTSITLGTGGTCAALDTVADPTFATSVTTPLLQSTGAIAIQTGGGANNITLGSSDTTGTLLVLDIKTDAGDPAGVDGSMYYNSSLGKFRCYQGGAWADCIAASGGFVALQNAYNNSTGGTTSEIIVDSTRGALDIQDRSTTNGGTIGANLLNVRATAADDSTAGALLFGIGNTGAALFQNSVDSANAFQIQNAAGASLVNVDTTANTFTLGTSSVSTSGIIFGDLTLMGGSTGTVFQDFNGVTFPPSSPGTWTTGGTANWSRDTATLYEGAASAGTVTMGNNTASYLDVDYTFTEPTNLSFYWKVSSWAGADYLLLCVDNDSCTRTTGYNQRISGEVGWTKVTIALSPGAHSIRWVYAKDAGLASGSDKGWVDYVHVTPASGGNLTVGGKLYVSSSIDTLASTVLSIGDVNASSITVGRAAAPLTLNGSTVSMNATGGVSIANTDTGDELEIGDDIFNLNDNAARINLMRNNGTAAIRMGQSATDYMTVAWQGDLTSAFAYGLINTSNSVQHLALQSSGGSVNIGSTAEPAAGVKLQIDTGNFASVGQTNFISSAQGNYIIDIDSNANETTSAFSITRDGVAATLLSVDQTGLLTAGAATFATSVTTPLLQSTGAIAIQTGGGANNITLGSSDTTGTLLVLDIKTDAGDPAGVDGSMYYNSSLGKFRCYQGGAWADCIAASGGFVALQNAYNNSTGGTTSEIIVDSTRGALDIQDRSTTNGGTIGANLLNVRATAADDSTAGALLFGIGNTGAALFQNSTDSANAFQIQNVVGASFLTADSTTRSVAFAPAHTGQVSITSDLTGGARSTPAFSITQANDVTTNTIGPMVNISNSDTGSTAPMIDLLQGAPTATAMQFNANLTSGNAIRVSGTGNNNPGGNVTVASGTSPFSGSYILVNPARHMTSGTGTYTESGNFLNLTRSNFNDTAGAGVYAITGDLATLSSNCTQNTSSCTDSSSILSLNQQYANSTGAVLKVQGAGTGNLVQVTDTTAASADVFTIANEGAATFRNRTNSTTAFQVQDASSSGLLTVDTTARSASGGNLIRIGNSTGTDTDLTILKLDSTTADPTSNLAALNGGMFYNSTTHKLSIIEDGQVKILCNTTDLGCGTGTITLQTAYNNSSDPEITLGSAATAGLTIRDNASPISGNLFQLQSNDGLSTYFAVASNSIALNNDTTLAAGKSLTIAGGITSSRPAAPTEGMLYYDTTAKSLLVYANGKWQADRSTATKIVAMGTATGCTGSTPVASSNADAADYVVTSCTSAQTTINSAISALPSGGGTIYLMEGTYIIDGSINLASNVTITGAGTGTVLKLKNGINTDINMFFTSSGQDMTISNMKLDGNLANNSSGDQYGLYLTSVGSSALNRGGAKILGMTITNFRASAVIFNGSDNGLIANNVFIANGSGSSHALVNLYGGSNYNTVTNNLIASGRYGLASSSSGNTITGNTFQGNTLGGIYLSSSSNNTTVSGNTLTANANAIDVTSGAQNLAITGNNITNNTGYGINITGGTTGYVTISGNNFYANATSTGSSIYLDGAGYNTVIGNSITGNGGTGYAINIPSSTSTGNYLSGNRFSGTGASSINDSGTATTYSGQLDSNGDIIMRRGTNSATAFQIQNASSSALFTADTTNGLIQVGSSTTDANARLLVLDAFNGADESGFTGSQNVDGAMYYNTNLGKFRCRQNGTWADCIAASGGFVALQNAYNNSTGGTTPEIRLDITRKGVDIQDADSTIGANEALLAVRGSATATTLGSAYFQVVGDGRVGVGSIAANTMLNIVGSADNVGLKVQGGLGSTGAGGDALQAIGGNGADVFGGGVGGTGGGASITGGTGGESDINTGGTGGSISLTGGAGGNSSTDVGGAGGNVTIMAGNSGTGGLGGGNGGSITITSGTGGTGTDGNITLQANRSSVTVQGDGSTAFQLQKFSTSEPLFTVNAATRDGVTAGNVIKIGNSTGLDAALTILQLDAATADPTTNLASMNGGLFYNSTTGKVSIIEGGTVKVLCNTTDRGCGGGTHRKYLVPEYPGAILTADGSNNTGTVTSDFDSVNVHNYYSWTSSQGTLNDYDIVVRTGIPSDYVSGFGTFKIWAYGTSNNTANNDIQVTIKDASGTACASLISVLPGTAATWTQQTVALSGCTFAANDLITITIHMASQSNNTVRVGEISYEYSN